ncbi:MAG: twin-arginine translocase TatA/TatE family subunit [Anaerolineae bacterium]|nr:twin-arginine translocase TatA/TatE family subunit [Anaerolineae bacterium]
MLARVGTLEWIIVLVIALLIFGPGRITKLAKELGQSIQTFQHAMKEEPSGNNEHETA